MCRHFDNRVGRLSEKRTPLPVEPKSVQRNSPGSPKQPTDQFSWSKRRSRQPRSRRAAELLPFGFVGFVCWILLPCMFRICSTVFSLLPHSVFWWFRFRARTWFLICDTGIVFSTFSIVIRRWLHNFWRALIVIEITHICLNCFLNSMFKELQLRISDAFSIFYVY